MKFKFYVSLDRSGREEVVEIDDDELEGKTDKEIDDYVEREYFLAWRANHIDDGFSRVD